MATLTSLVDNAPAGLRENYATIGWYSDQLSSVATTAQMRATIDHLKAVGYGGIEFGISASVSSAGVLQSTLTYDRMWTLVDYAKSIGMAVAIAPDWVINGNVAGYVPEPSGGQPLPAGFSMQTLVQSYGTFFSSMATKAQSHGVDLLLLNNCGGQGAFAAEFVPQWTSIIADIRSKFTGALSTMVFTENRATGSTADRISIWSLLDGITLGVRETISKTPVEDLGQIISGYLRSMADGSSLVSEVVRLATSYHKPVLLTYGNFGTDRALDPWDSTPDQLVDHVIPTNYSLQARAYAALLEVASQLLFPFVTGVSLQSFEPWALGSWTAVNGLSQAQVDMFSNFKYTSLMLFPTEPISVISQFLANPAAFKPVPVIEATRGNDTVYTRGGANIVHLNGGFDDVHGGSGADTVVAEPKTTTASVTFSAELWTTSPADHLAVDVFLGNAKIGSLSLQADAAKLAASPSGVFTDPTKFTFDLPTNNIEGLTLRLHGIGAFSHVWNVVVSLPEGEIRIPVHDGRDRDVFTLGELQYTLSTSSQPAAAVVDGGDGIDSLVFESSTQRAQFVLTHLANSTHVTDMLDRYVPLDLTHVERLIFSDRALALDLDGNAGLAVKLLGVVFGPGYSHDAAYIGIGLHLLDGGMPYAALMEAALNFRLGTGYSNQAEVALLYRNLTGVDAPPSEVSYYADIIASGQVTQVSLAVLAGETSFNLANVDMVGLSATGVEYV